MKKRLLAALLSVALFSSNLGINTYAMEEVSEVNVVQEEEVQLEEEELRIIDLQEEKEEAELPEGVEEQEQESETGTDGLIEESLEENSSNEGNPEEEPSEEGLLETEESTETEEQEESEASEKSEEPSEEVLVEGTVSENALDSNELEELPGMEVMAGNVITSYADLVNALKNGGTYTINGSITTDQPSGDVPLIVKEDVIFNGGSITSSYAGLILEADATFNNTALQFKSNAYIGIFANGHHLTLSDTTIGWDHADPFSISAGGVKNNTSFNASEGSNGKITLSNVTFSSGSSQGVNIYSGNIYNTTSGAANNDTGVSYPVDISISGISGAKLNIYGHGGTFTGETIADAYNDKIVPSAFNKVTGAVNIHIVDASNSFINSIDGATGVSNVGAILNLSSAKGYTTTFQAENLGGIKLAEGEKKTDIKLTEDFNYVFYNSAQINLPAGTKLDLTNLSNVKVKDFYGGGELVLGEEQLLTITGNITGSTDVGIGEIFASKGKDPKEGHTYIISENSAVEESFNLLPSNSDPDLAFVYENGNWRAPGTPEVTEEETKIASVSIKDGYESINASPDSKVVYKGLEVTLTDEYDDIELSWLPIQFMYKGSMIQPIGPDEDLYYHSLVTINRKEYKLEFTGTTLYISENGTTAGLPEGTHEFYVIFPKDYMANGQQKSVSFTIVSGDQEEETTNAAAPTITAVSEAQEYTLKQTGAQISVTAQSTDNGELSYQWYKNTSNSTIGGEKIDGAVNASYTPSTDKAGTTYYYCEVTNTNSNVNGQQKATLISETIQVTVGKGEGQVTVSLSNWEYGQEAKQPVITSATNETVTATFKYSGTTKAGEHFGPSLHAPNEAGNYKVVVTLLENDDYTSATAETVFEITPKPISIQAAEIDEKQYDGTTDASIKKVTFKDSVQEGVTLVSGEDFEASAQFTDGEIGKNKDVTVTVTMKNTNYSLAVKTFTAKGTIAENWGDISEEERTEQGYTNLEDVPEALWVSGVKDIDYCGKAVTQDDLSVYHHLTKLTPNVDYTVKYKNNINAGDATITITGKGNYEGSIVKTFEILPLNFENAILAEEEVTFAYNKKVQKGTTTVSYVLDGKIVTLKAGKDFTYIYPGTDPKGAYDADAFNKPNQGVGYTIILRGKGNYQGEKELVQFITEKTLISKLTLTKIPDQKYTDITDFKKGIEPEITLKNGKYLVDSADYTVVYKDNKAVGTATVIITAKEGSDFAGTKTATFKITGTALSKAKMNNFVATKEWIGSEVKQNVSFVETRTNGASKEDYTLIEDTDYTVEYQNNTAVGTATVIYTGKGGYTGSIKKTFKITGTAISKVTVEGLVTELPYAGSAVEQYDYVLTYQKGTDEEDVLVENEDFKVSYKNNNKAGSATIIFTGINGYTGTLNKTFKITALDMKKGSVKVEEIADQIYTKGGVFPEPKVTYEEDGSVITLEKGIDYALSYANNKAIADRDLGKKAPTITVTGKGGLKGKITKTFTILPGDLQDTDVSITATDITYQAKSGICKPTITLTDSDGKKLAAGTDYNKVITYQYAGKIDDSDAEVTVTQLVNKVPQTVERSVGKDVESLDIIPAGTRIKATVTGIKNYEGSKEVYFRYVQGDLSKATITIPTQTYTGKRIELDKSEISVKLNGVFLSEDDFEIVSYENNIAKGTAKVTIVGTDLYGGTKTATFKINSRSMNYQLVFDPNAENSTGTMKNVFVSSGSKLPANAFKKVGYTFVGWSTEKDGNGDVFVDKSIFETTEEKPVYGKTIILYAQWDAISYTIKYELNDSQAPELDGDIFPADYTIEDRVELDAPYERKGYSFLGWYTDKGFSQSKLTEGIEKGSTGNKVFYAKWEAIPYTITYHLNDEDAPGLNAKNFPETYTTEKEIILRAPYERKGYEFGGWYKDSGFINSVDKIEKGTTENLELYAKWNIINYSITYHLNYDEAPELDEELFPRTYTVEDQITLKEPEKEDWSFQGWYTDSIFSASKKVTEIAKGSTGNKVFYAKWKIPFTKPVPVPESYIDVSIYKVYPDDDKDDTQGIYEALQEASKNYGTDKPNTVYLPEGVYNVTPVTTYNPRYDLQGIVVPNNTNLIMDNNAILEVAGTDLDEYVVIDIQRKSNVTVQGGQICGERYRHKGKGGEGGKGICIIASTNVTISSVFIASNWGDGIYLGAARNKQSDGSQKLVGCSNITIEDCEIFDNRRNNIAIVDADNVMIDHCHIYDANGIAPQCGILNEPNAGSVSDDGINYDITIKDTIISAYRGINSRDYRVFYTISHGPNTSVTTANRVEFINCKLNGFYENCSGKNVNWTNVEHIGTRVG